MRFSYNFKNISIAALLLLLIVGTMWLLVAIKRSPFALQYPLIYFALFMILAIIFVIVGKRADKFDRGEEGEMKIHNKLLSFLPETFTPLHDILIGNTGNIDEVVVSPFGIWTFEVKNYKNGEITYKNGKLCINNHTMHKDGLGQAYREAEELRSFINEDLGLFIPVTPVLVFANTRDKMKFGMHEINGVHVIGIGWLDKFFTEQNMTERITDDQCARIMERLKSFKSVI